VPIAGYQSNSLDVATAGQEERRRYRKAEKRNPAGDESGMERGGERHGHEHHRDFDHVDVHDSIGDDARGRGGGETKQPTGIRRAGDGETASSPPT